jgi:predicted NAD/FAD-dependent oxidoreductase
MMSDVMRESERDADVLVIGAGMAGVTAAAELQRAGRRVLVLDKGRAVGGRLASRRVGAATFDHGAQFITARTPRFAAVIEECREAGVVEEWCRGFAERADGHARWRGRPAIAAVAKHLARGLEIVLETQVVALRRSEAGWTAVTQLGEAFCAGAVVLTAPVPQSLAIMEAGGLTLAAETRTRLEGIAYERCLAVLAVLSGPSRLAPPGGLAPVGGPIAWIADNQLKGISAEPSVTIHANHAFSLERWEHDRQESGRQLLSAAAPWLGASTRTFQVHGWRYSKPMQTDERPCLIVSEDPPLVLAGDGFAGPRVEGAALSGWAAAEAILAGAS